MTPFMLRVQALSGAEPPPEPAVVATEPRGVAEGTDRHVAVRTLTEQLVAEANAVLGPGALDLTDRAGLAFTVRHGTRATEIVTTVSGGAATARLDGTDIELADENAVAELLLGLLAP